MNKIKQGERRVVMTKEELLARIEESFEQLGQRDSWIYMSYQNLYKKKQLDRFKIFKINWFPGAEDLLELIDELHTLETSKDDFIKIGKLLELEIDKDISKQEIAKLIKSNKSWKTKSYELERNKQFDKKRICLEPLYKELALYGYITSELPQNIKYKRWVLECVKDGKVETLYLSENDESNYLLVQSNKEPIIAVLDLEKMGLCEKI